MLPILATIGSGLAWFAATAGQLIFWGAGISIGFWVGKKITNTWDVKWASNLIPGIRNRLRKQDADIEAQVMAAAATNPS